MPKLLKDAKGEVSEDDEIKMLQKLVKQRKDSLQIYQQQNRPDLAKKEEEEIAIIEKFFQSSLVNDELKKELKKIIRNRSFFTC